MNWEFRAANLQRYFRFTAFFNFAEIRIKCKCLFPSVIQISSLYRYGVKKFKRITIKRADFSYPAVCHAIFPADFFLRDLLSCWCFFPCIDLRGRLHFHRHLSTRRQSVGKCKRYIVFPFEDIFFQDNYKEEVYEHRDERLLRMLSLVFSRSLFRYDRLQRVHSHITISR